MPNDCWNTVRMSGKEETIQALIDEKFSFQALCPMPEFPKIQDLSGEDDRWYHWRNEHWGTKWDHYEYEVVKQGPNGLIVKFTTAWSPPYAFFEHLLEKFPDLWLHCEWHEEGGYAGVCVGGMKDDKLEFQEMHWEDWCIEESFYLFAPKKPQEGVTRHPDPPTVPKKAIVKKRQA